MTVDIKTASDMIYLLSCAVNQTDPDHDRLKDADIDSLFDLSEAHSLTAAVAYGLERAGIADQRFIEAKARAMRFSALNDIACRSVYAMLSSRGIRYLPLKGIVLKSLYPAYGMREMSDVDVLCGADRMSDVHEGMIELGFDCESYGSDYEDVYHRDTVTFEMHSRLFYRKDVNSFNDYYADIWDRLVKDEGGSTGYRFTPEDMYIYQLAHEYKHYKNGGTGLRSLLDVYVYLREYGASMDSVRLSAELNKLRLTDFERVNRELSAALFTTGELTENNREELEYFLQSGTYGSLENIRYNKTTRAMKGKDSFGAKVKYLLGIVFIHGDMLKRNYPFVARHKILLPALYIYRILRAIFIQPFKTIADLKYVKDYKKTVDTSDK